MQEITCAYCGKNLIETNNRNNGQQRYQIQGHYYFNNQTICTECWDKRNRMRPALSDLNMQTSINPLKANIPE